MITSRRNDHKHEMFVEARKLARLVFVLAGPKPIQVFVRIKKGILVRFTNNGVHQNGFRDLLSYTIRLSAQGKNFYAESNDSSEEGIQRALDRASQEVPNPDPLKILNRKTYPKVQEFFPLRLDHICEKAAATVEDGLNLIRKKNSSANGYYSAYERFFYLANSSGEELFHPATSVRFGVTATKGTGKGYSSFYHADPRKLKVASVVQEAMELAEKASGKNIALEPGEYECVFSPRAFLEFIEPFKRHFDRHLYETRKSVFWNLLGKQIFSTNLTLLDQVDHPKQFGVPFDSDGAPKRKVTLIERGVLKELLAEGHSTRGILEHPFYPQNLIVEEGNLSLPDIFKRIRRGIFVNKIWYHTLVRESRMEVTGLVIGGSLCIERGRVRGRVVGLRYHDSVLAVLRSVVGMTKEQRLLKDGEMGAALLPYVWCSRFRVV